MQTRPYCGKALVPWRMGKALRWQRVSTCPFCRKQSSVSNASAVLASALGGLPVVGLGVWILTLLNVRPLGASKPLAVLVPVGVLGFLLQGWLLAEFGEFRAVDS